MCGLVAVISKQKTFGFGFKDKTIFLQMLISDMFRGMDSTGCFGVNKFGNLKMVKDASASPFFINKKEATAFLDKFISDYHICIGHNRKTTMGATNPQNAHPFIEGNICLVHNGTLQNHYQLANRVVDSNAVAAHINAFGYKSLLKKIEGAYALIWYNAEEKTLYFTRNAERPLFLVETEDRIYLASEDKMLDWILDRNDLTKYSIQNVPTDKVFKFNMDTRELTAESKPKKASPPKQPNWKTQRHGGMQHQMGYGNLALAYSSDKEPTKKELTKASIETYNSGETVTWRLLDWEYKTGSCKFQGETTDTLRTPVTIFLDLNIWSKKDIEKFIAAEWLTSEISTVTSKHGNVRLFVKTLDVEEKWTTANHIKVTKGEIDDAGGACYSCGTVIENEKDVMDTIIEADSKGNIQYITCSDCAIVSKYTHGSYC